ncbi:endonuclease/exonuclease/phosphatase family protein [Paracoccus sp. p4-l81]|uniref:endonuclease/exonuclease/phosphatase family protein n=1 Tax=Paracoccus sp. p4-l81 TaxID=3342806 RepID=UPI0035B6CC66
MRKTLAIFGLLALLASFGGALHPLGDSLAVFRPVWAGLVVLAGLTLPGRLRWALVIAGLVGLGPILLSAFMPAPAPQGPVLTVYQKNILFKNPTPADLIADIRASGADLVFLQESFGANRDLPDGLSDLYPHRLRCAARVYEGVLIMSRWPMSALNCAGNQGMASARVETPLGPVTAAAVHLHWPWPYGQADQMAVMRPVMAALPGPVIIGGDFNSVAWSQTLAMAGQATGTERVRPVQPTFDLAGVYPMAIDHVLVPQGWAAAAETRPKLGSDHRGLLVRIAPPGGVTQP